MFFKNWNKRIETFNINDVLGKKKNKPSLIIEKVKE